tara:strand:+ start:467 stop:1063 length:597 start_codon:yes stop_codon:yes gene_type:complete
MAISEKAIKFIGDRLNQGRPIPGQSLTNSPEQPYNWERPAEFTEPQEAMFAVFDALTEDQALENILFSINKGVGVIDLASITLYTGYIEGKWNADLMLLLMEPTMYMIMALAEKAEMDYVLESGDTSKKTEEDSESRANKMRSAVQTLDDVRRKAVQDVNPQSVPQEVREVIEQKEIPESLLGKVQEEENKSLLSKKD